MHADITKNKKVLLKIRKTFADIICQINMEHKKKVSSENWQKILYMLVLCSIYGCIESDLHWYSETLREKVFELNSYDIYVANNMVNCKNVPLCGMWTTTKYRIWKQN